MAMPLPDALHSHLPGIREIVEQGFADYDDRYRDVKQVHDATCRASIRSCHMFERASAYAASHPDDVTVFKVKRLRGILIAQFIALIFKKFDDELVSMNNHTKQSRAYRDQRPIDGIPALVHLIAGYQQDEETGEMTGSFVTRPSGRRNEWAIQLDGFATMRGTAPLFEPVEEELEAEVRRRKAPGEVIPIRREKNDGSDKS